MKLGFRVLVIDAQENVHRFPWRFPDSGRALKTGCRYAEIVPEARELLVVSNETNDAVFCVAIEEE